MDSKDPASPSPAPVAVPPPAIEEPSPSPSLTASSAAHAPSSGSVPPQSDLVTESSAGAALAAEEADAGSGFEGVVDETSDSKGAILPVKLAEDDAVAPSETDGPPPAEEATLSPPPGTASVAPAPLPIAEIEVMEDDGSQILGNEGEALAVIDDKGDEATTVSSLEDSMAGVSIVNEEEKDSPDKDFILVAAADAEVNDPVADTKLKPEAGKLELANLPAEKIGPDDIAVDGKALSEPLIDESNLLEPVKTEPDCTMGPPGALPAAQVDIADVSAHTMELSDIDKEALSKPMEAESSAVDSAETATANHMNIDAHGETESKSAEAGENVDVDIYDSSAAEERTSAGDANLKAGSEVLKSAATEGSVVVLGEMLGHVEAINSMEQHLSQPSHVTQSLSDMEFENKVAEIPCTEGDEASSPVVDEVKSAADCSPVTENNDKNMGSPVVKEEEEDGLSSNGPAGAAVIKSNEVVEQIIKQMIEGASGTNENSDFSQSIDEQIVTDSEEEIETDEEDNGKELIDSAALAALLRAATGSTNDGSFTFGSQDSGRIFTVDRPAGLGSAATALKPSPARSVQFPAIAPSELALMREEESSMNEEDRKLHEQVEHVRVKFLRLVQRLKHSPEDTVAAQVLYRLGLAEGIRSGRNTRRSFDLENAKRKALELEAEGKVDLNFSCNILVIGKTGAGKSATINSIFGEERAQINTFEAATMSLKEISGVVDGVKVRVIDTPGLRASAMEQSSNRKILSAIKKYTKKCPPDIVLYVDRLDTQTRDLNDLPLLRSITSTLGSSIWFNAIIALTHAASAPPDGPNGSPLSYEVFLAQRSHVVQHLIRQTAGDMRLMNPVALVENHPLCRRNKDGERVLPNGLSWRPQMLLLCYSSKILSEANSLLKLQEPSPGKLFGFRLRSPPLPFLLSSLLQSRMHPKLPADQGGDNGDSDLDLDDFSDADEDEDEYDQLPPFKTLRRAQIAKLTKEQQKAYFEEYDYRVKLLQKKQWKEEIRRMKDMKKKGKSGQDDFDYGDMAEDDQYAAPAAVPVPLPDMVLPPSFDCDNPVYRYRFLEPTSQLLTRPVLETHSWDHDCGYDGVSIENSLALSGCFPAGVTVQITKDKKDFNIHFDSSVAMKHGQNASTLACFEIQPVGRQLGYTLRAETKFKNLKKNKTTGGISVTFLGENVATGLKVEDQLSVGKRLSLVASTGAIRAQGDMAYGANLEARLRDKDFPVGQALTTLGLSLMKWRSDLALGANVQSQFSIGRNSKVAVRVGLNNKLSGQITIKTNTSEQLQIGLLAILPIAASIFRTILSAES